MLPEPLAFDLIHRRLEEDVRESFTDTPACVILGPRQSGKSLFVQQFKERTTLTLDDPEILQRVRANPGDFLDSFPGPLTIDEVQRAPELFLPMKMRIDRDRRPGKYLLTGSTNIFSLPKIADSLAGRLEVFDLLPLSQAELNRSPKRNFVDVLMDGKATPEAFASLTAPSEGSHTAVADVVQRIERGGFPEPTRRSPKRRAAWYSSYLRTMLERDVRDIANIEGLHQLPRLLALIAARQASSFNLNSLSQEIGISYTTLRRYLDILKSIFLVQEVRPWSSNLSSKIVKSPKVYLVDSCLTCQLLKLDAAELNQNPNRLGPVLEGFVANELARLRAYSESKPTLLHLRSIRSQEVDFVLESSDGVVAGVEVKASRNLMPTDYSGMKFLEELAEDQFAGGVILYGGDEIKPISPRITALPYRALWS